MELQGIHHLTAVTAQPARNHRFYTQTLGMRLVKKTVNQDDTTAYHLFYGDGAGSPGSDLTFFDFPVAPERRGIPSIGRTSLRVDSEEVLEWWVERLRREGVEQQPLVERQGRSVLDFEDFEGQRLSLVADREGSAAGVVWSDSPVPPAYQIRGLGPVMLHVPDLRPTDAVVTQWLGMETVGDDAGGAPDTGPHARTTVYRMGPGGAAAELHVTVDPSLPRARPGAGGAHHVAFRIRDDDYDAWARHLEGLRLPYSGPVDRHYFRSLYFREPNGILFELATDGPGFDVDEPVSELGRNLSLPPFLEPQRASIEARLKPLG